MEPDQTLPGDIQGLTCNDKLSKENPTPEEKPVSPQNPAQHARVAADAITRLVNDVKTGRAQWTHTDNAKQAADDFTRLSEAMAAALQQMAAALGQIGRGTPQTDQAIGALHQAGQAEVVASRHLRRARQTMY
ncbi:hypothetical protein B7755_052085 [Streptomyces sp. NBS 14/10]|uniref:hypothetical protein n=1 Tax=Streptomyces sp. NBS 14/10 TaxID=1945643 RepID=UPI0011801DB6|nr:hypothetical protein [Streptomyces sp. NBS 14/10]KAK1176689.1 hypothetical protein B7755_052085 [Streptomyces sp. NBS 14/10]